MPLPALRRTPTMPKTTARIESTTAKYDPIGNHARRNARMPSTSAATDMPVLGFSPYIWA